MLHARREGPIALWTIDRPATKNALDHATLEALLIAAQRASSDVTLRAAVLAGAGDAFVSGGDLRELRHKNTRADAERFGDLGYEACSALANLPFPVIAALTGPAIGGGAEVAMACDLRIADVRATIAFKQVRLGVTTAWGTVPRLVGTVGRAAAARLLFMATELSANEAKAIGLVNEVAAAGLAESVAMTWAKEIAAGSPRAVAGMKQLLLPSSSPLEARALERQLFVDTWSAADHGEAVEAYFARREPCWVDR